MNDLQNGVHTVRPKCLESGTDITRKTIDGLRFTQQREHGFGDLVFEPVELHGVDLPEYLRQGARQSVIDGAIDEVSSLLGEEGSSQGLLDAPREALVDQLVDLLKEILPRDEYLLKE